MISVLLPTVRPNLIERCFASIEPACGSVPYEVVVIADFDPFNLAGFSLAALERCTWIMRERRGVINAVNEACTYARGSHWFVFNDESVLDDGALETLYVEALKSPRVLLGPEHVPHYTFQYYGRQFIPFPFAHRELFAELGGVFDPVFKSFYADPDLGMRAHAAGIQMRVVDGAIIRHNNGQDNAKVENMARYMSSDQATFRARWAHLGVFCDC